MCLPQSSFGFLAGAIPKSHQLLNWGKEQGQHHTRVYAEYRCQMGVSAAVEQLDGAAQVLERWPQFAATGQDLAERVARHEQQTGIALLLAKGDGSLSVLARFAHPALLNAALRKVYQHTDEFVLVA